MVKLDIDSKLIIRLLVWGAGLWLIFVIYDIILLLFIAYIVMTALYPAVKRLEENQVPRWLGIIGIFLAFLLTMGIIVGISLPPLVEQTRLLVESIPVLVNRLIALIDVQGYLNRAEILAYVQQIIQALSSELGTAPASIIRFGAGLINNFIASIMVLVFSFYLLMEREKVRKVLVALIPFPDKKKLRKFVEQVDEKLGDWLRGQVLLMFTIGIMSFAGLLVLGIPYAVPLAVLAGLFEVIPIVGPIISLIPALLVAITISPVKALLVLVLYLFIQQLEGNLIVPRVMKKAVGLDPLMVIVAIMVGTRLAGPLGAMLSIPIAAIFMIFLVEWSRNQE